VTTAAQTLGDCPSCGLPLPFAARFCPGCGAAADGDLESPPPERAPGPVNVQRVELRWLGVPASVMLLCLGFAALGGAVGLFASGRWPWGLVLLGVAVLLLGGYGELSVDRGDLGRRSALLVAESRERAASVSAVWHARLDEALHRRRARLELHRLEGQRRPALQELGRAVHGGDEAGEARARAQLLELDERRVRIERELDERLSERNERIRRARLPVDQTVMVAPTEPSPPYPPPDEGTPPTPTPVPEPYPPPDEGTPPTPGSPPE
jgi:hypothetical protein